MFWLSFWYSKRPLGSTSVRKAGTPTTQKRQIESAAGDTTGKSTKIQLTSQDPKFLQASKSLTSTTTALTFCTEPPCVARGQTEIFH